MPLDKRDVETALLKKGFVREEGDHSFFRYWTISGNKTSIYTKTSHGSGYKTLGDNLVSKMAKQCDLENNQFKQLVACPLTRSELEKILVNKGRIEPK
jgi:predicted RNA binding protein YcfA (HicA-like mRNA interferase family)